MVNTNGKRINDTASKMPVVHYIDVHWYMDPPGFRPRGYRTPDRAIHFSDTPPEIHLLQLKCIGATTKAKYRVDCVQAIDPDPTLFLDYPEMVTLCRYVEDRLAKLTGLLIPIIEVDFVDLGNEGQMAQPYRHRKTDGKTDNRAKNTGNFGVDGKPLRRASQA